MVAHGITWLIVHHKARFFNQSHEYPSQTIVSSPSISINTDNDGHELSA